MQSKNKPSMTVAERRHVDRVKQIPCSVCDTPGPSEAHEIEQGEWYTSVALCGDCHRGSVNGIHGQRRIWNVKKINELRALGITVRRVVDMTDGAPHA